MTSPSVDDNELQRLAKEKEAAEIRLSIERNKLEAMRIAAEQQRLVRPWWRSWNIAALAALVSAITPVTAGVKEYFQKEKELALQIQKQKHTMALEQEKQIDQIQNGYLDRIANPGSRRRVLRFLIATSPNPAVKTWAEQELSIVNAEVEGLKTDYEMQRSAAIALSQEIEIMLKDSPKELLQYKLARETAAIKIVAEIHDDYTGYYASKNESPLRQIHDIIMEQGADGTGIANVEHAPIEKPIENIFSE